MKDPNLIPAPVHIINPENGKKFRRFMPIWPYIEYETVPTSSTLIMVAKSYAAKFYAGKWWLIRMTEFIETKAPTIANKGRDEEYMRMALKSKLKFHHSLVMEKYEPDENKKDLVGNYVDMLFEGVNWKIKTT